jgi:hypothetical protein
MVIRWDESDLQNYINKNKGKNNPLNNPFNNTKRISKYNSKKVKIDGHCFDSIKESQYYSTLKLLLKSKKIKGFCLQSKFILGENISYKADFIVFELDGSCRIIDIKGYETEIFKLKKKLFDEEFDLYLEIEK